MQSVGVVGTLSGMVVVGFGLFLIGLAALIATAPARAERFLRAFASSARTHYTEQGVRLVVGLAMVNCASAMRHADFFRLFGWLVIVSTLALLLTPWRWHHRFAVMVMPPVFRYMGLFAFGALALGGFVLYGAAHVVGW